VNCFWPPQHFVCQDVLPGWIERVEEVTEGRVRGLIPPKSVAAPPEQWDSVVKGIADVAPQFNGFVQNRVQGPLVAMNLFTGINDAPAMSQALWETYEKYFPDEYEGIKLLSLWVITPGEVWSQTDEPIMSVEDLANRKIWTLPGPPAALLKDIGSGAVAGPAVQANEIISRGVVDGYIALSPNSVESFQLVHYTKHRTSFEKGLYTTSFSLLMNEDKWNEISPEDQAAIMEVSGASFGRFASQFWVDLDAKSEGVLAEAGIEFHKAPAEFEAALVEKSAGITRSWIDKASAKGIDAEAALEFYRNRALEISGTN
jgi:TRAP-type C4-dicarboxylate transport system substrate-binding protein